MYHFCVNKNKVFCLTYPPQKTSKKLTKAVTDSFFWKYPFSFLDGTVFRCYRNMTSPDLIIFLETFPPMFWNPAVESGHRGSSHTHMDLTGGHPKG